MTPTTETLPTPAIQPTPLLTKTFVTAGHAIFTVSVDPAFASRHGLPPHYTYRVKKVDDERGGATYFVGLLTGRSNTTDYTYVGILDPLAGTIRLTRASRYLPESWPVKVLGRVLARVWAGDVGAIRAAGWGLNHEGRCGRCGRVLTTPESCRIGFGPECANDVF